MSSDAVQITHYIITGITSLSTAVLAYMKLRDDKIKSDSQSNAVCKQDLQNLQIKIAVLEERLENEIDVQEKIERKLDNILEQL